MLYFARFIIIFLVLVVHNQILAQNYTQQDSIRGTLNKYRSCYDVKFYDLFIMLDDIERSIERSYNIMHVQANTNFDKIQIDLFENMEIMIIEFEDEILNFTKNKNASYIEFPRTIKKEEIISLKIWFGGYPITAKNPPWDGGFTWSEDSNKAWVGVSCQGIGASLWWPCKDHQSDEPDSMRITISVRSPLNAISNGRLKRDTSYWSNYMNSWMNEYEWFVSYPINNYNVTLNVANYSSFEDILIRNEDTLDLSYYVLKKNLSIAKNHFKQVKPIITCLEKYLGSYPFERDGFTLVETPYLGMEHQSCIAYGNNYQNGYNGNTKFIDNLEFDYIILHEAGHEWWGNSITTNDIADMWVHEGFCTYSEALFVECYYGYEKMLSYLKNQRKFIVNDKPIISDYGVNKQGSRDMYFKSALMLHTLRSLVDNDTLFFKMLLDINKDFKYRCIDGDELINYIVDYLKIDLKLFFQQYLTQSSLPEFNYKLEVTGKDVVLICNWNAMNGFDMPIKASIGKKEDIWINTSNKIKEIKLGNIDVHDFRIRDDLFLISVKKM